ncbi:VanW family protein [Sediminibacillus halophilus]|uniref:Vancomycin resistance protein YoaR, contains peptidoglycan-binding and VanW domains n=1 Tax=Sediminibacillus halophilus TaxID=482461 RepID=A0A1G9PEG2_9BACI|nr:VanW family protein [Sediminibacillus halophilus]SDL97170.1 Vancomycin resistance protein YoaR, contains peptidoglycan-binding and VanW domains [Sediminibacillus halophilus]
MKMFLLSILLASIIPTQQHPPDPPRQPIKPEEQQAQTFTVTHKDKAIHQITAEDVSLPYIEGLWLDMEKYKQFQEEVASQVYREPVNARIDVNGRITPAKPGRELDLEQFNHQFAAFFYGREVSKVETPLRVVHPRVDEELLASIRERKIGQYVTYYNENNKERSKNVALAAEAIDSHVVFPNETFSFNGVVGKRTKEKGYLPAPVIVKGELAEDIGGGICQISSTLYNAVDQAGVKIIERYSHSRRVPYVPPGRDATVSWYGPDFSFENDYNQPILIRAKAVNGRVLINIFSSETIENEKREVPEADAEPPKEVPAE